MNFERPRAAAPVPAGGRGRGGAAPGGTGFAAATMLARGMSDLSMGDADLGETQNYDFKENENDAQEMEDDIDDFERRLAGGAAPRTAPKPARAASASKPPVRQPPGGLPVPGKSGAAYVQAAKDAKQAAQSKPVRARKVTKKPDGDDDDDFADRDDSRAAMAALSKFDKQMGGADSDDD